MGRKKSYRSEERKAQIDKMITRLENMLSALKTLRNTDEAESTILHEYGIDPSQFRRIVYDIDWDEKKPDAPKKTKRGVLDPEQAVPTRNWAEDLFCDAFSIPKTPASCGKIPPDITETMEIVIKEFPEREYDVLSSIYKDGLTMQEVAEQCGMPSYQRVQQIKEHALRKLRNPNRLSYFVYGDGYYLDKKAMRKAIEQDYYVKKAMTEVERLDKLIRLRRATLREDPALLMAEAKMQPLENMHLGIRAYNCLKRAGIQTIEDLISLKFSEVLKIRNLGSKCAEEVRETLYGLGYVFAEEEEEVTNG